MQKVFIETPSYIDNRPSRRRFLAIILLEEKNDPARAPRRVLVGPPGAGRALNNDTRGPEEGREGY
jgi:hypothetical protein